MCFVRILTDDSLFWPVPPRKQPSKGLSLNLPTAISTARRQGAAPNSSSPVTSLLSTSRVTLASGFSTWQSSVRLWWESLHNDSPGLLMKSWADNYHANLKLEEWLDRQETKLFTFQWCYALGELPEECQKDSCWLLKSQQPINNIQLTYIVDYHGETRILTSNCRAHICWFPIGLFHVLHMCWPIIIVSQ